MRLPQSTLALVAILGLAACESPAVPAQYPESGVGQFHPPGEAPPQGYPPGQYAPGQFQPQGTLPAQGYAPGQYQPQGYPQNPAPPPGQAQVPPQSYPQLPPQAAQADPINTVDIDYLRATARGVLGELVAALPPAAQAKVQGIPFRPDTKTGEVNAYAGCDEQHQPYMSVTDALLQIEAYMSQLRAADEVFGGQKLDGYVQMVARYEKPGQPVVTPPAGYVDPAQQVDPRKVARQHQLLEEQLAFVLGHELGHHHLGHTGCAVGQSGGRQVTLGDLGRIVNKVVPVTNQYNEIAADGIGIDDVLAAGARRPGYHWTEGGALLTLYFFSQLQQLTAESLALSILSSHPNPALRVDPIRREAARFRATGAWYQPILPTL
jgi:hypothetical protein